MYEVESGVPLPTGSGKRYVFPFRTMKVGDSFVVPSAKQRESARAAAINASVKIITRTEGDSFRIWRVA